VEADYRLYGKTRLRAAVERRTTRRDHRARQHTRERVMRLALTSRDLQRLTLRLGYDTASRSGSPYGLDRLSRYFVSDLPGYVAPLPGGVRQNFHAAYGLRDRDADRANLQWNWRPRPTLEAHFFYGFERRSSEMGLINESFALSDDPNAAGPWFPLDNAWTERSRARSHHAGSGVRWQPHGRMELSFSYELHHTAESLRYDFASPGALPLFVTPGQAGDNLPDLRYRDHVLESELRFDLFEEASLRVFHRYARSFVRDFAQRGLVPNFFDRGVVLAHIDDLYSAHFFGFMAQLRF
jgi:hypothetical protein